MSKATERIDLIAVFTGASAPHVIFEIPYRDLPREAQERLQRALGDDDDSPNWTIPQLITVGCAMGASRINRLVYQGDVYWNVNDAFEFE